MYANEEQGKTTTLMLPAWLISYYLLHKFEGFSEQHKLHDTGTPGSRVGMEFLQERTTPVLRSATILCSSASFTFIFASSPLMFNEPRDCFLDGIWFKSTVCLWLLPLVTPDTDGLSGSVNSGVESRCEMPTTILVCWGNSSRPNATATDHHVSGNELFHIHWHAFYDSLLIAEKSKLNLCTSIWKSQSLPRFSK